MVMQVDVGFARNLGLQVRIHFPSLIPRQTIFAVFGAKPSLGVTQREVVWLTS